MEINQLFLSLFIASLGALPGIWALVQQRKKIRAETEKFEAEAAHLISQASTELTMKYKQRIEELEGMVMELNKRIQTLEEELKNAHIEIKRLNGLLKGYGKRPGIGK